MLEHGLVPGDVVEKGDVLAIVKSPEIAQLKSSLVSKTATYEVERKELERYDQLIAKKLISESEYNHQSAETNQAKSEMVSIEGLLLSGWILQLQQQTTKVVREDTLQLY